MWSVQISVLLRTESHRKFRLGVNVLHGMYICKAGHVLRMYYG